MSAANPQANTHARAHQGKFDLAVQHHKAGNFKKAQALYQQVLRKNPRRADALYNLAILNQQSGRVERAVQLLQKAISIDSEEPAFYQALGVALRAMGRNMEAAAHLRTAAGLAPKDPDIQTGFGNALKAIGEFEEAVTCHRKALKLNPEFSEGWSNLGTTYREWGKSAEAVENLRRAVELAPENAEFHYNLGNAHLGGEDFAAAEASFAEALQINPVNARALTNLGTSVRQQGRIEQAAGHFRSAIELDPSYAEAHWNLSLALLMEGANEEGWREYEWRRKLPHFAMRRPGGMEWDGGRLDEGTLLVHAEQGLGDAIQFARYLGFAKERCRRLIFECPPPLESLLAGLEGVECLVPRGQPIPRYDAQVPLMSLPGLAWPGIGAASTGIPYLRPDAGLVASWGQRLGGDGFKVGICWQGNPDYQADRSRSVPLEHFFRLADIPGVRLVSLQKGPGRDQLLALPEAGSVEDLGPDVDEKSGAFVDSAAIIANLDLVISSDTAMPHLAGALGAEVWVALADVPDWRWGMKGDGSSWYPDMRLFRQHVPGDWDGVFAAIEGELMVRAR